MKDLPAVPALGMEVVDDRSPVEGHDPSGAPSTCDHPSCVASRRDRWMGPFLSIDRRNRATFHHRDVLHARVAQHAQVASRAAAHRYRSIPTDFASSWWYVKLHPIFWRYDPPLKGTPAGGFDAAAVADIEQPRNLVTDDGVAHMTVDVVYETADSDPEGPSCGVAVCVSHGPHLHLSDLDAEDLAVAPAAGLSTCDPRLSATADTFEAAIVALASNVAAIYGDDRSRLQQGELWAE